MPQLSDNTQKEWLYIQGTWTLVEATDDDAAFDVAYFLPGKTHIVTHGLDPEYEIKIYHRNTELKAEQEPVYAYYVAFTIQDMTQSFYIADYPSYLQLIPQLIDHIQKALALAQIVQTIIEARQQENEPST